MARYIALLRAINVSGKNKIAMADLRNVFTRHGFENVTTYLQSGNVDFQSSTKPDAGVIETAIEETFGLKVPVHILSQKELKQVFTGNPFLTEEKVDADRCYVTFLFQNPETSLIARLEVPAGETARFRSADQHIYLHCPHGYGRTKLNNQFYEKRLMVAATTRNWRTVTALVEICQI